MNDPPDPGAVVPPAGSFVTISGESGMDTDGSISGRNLKRSRVHVCKTCNKRRKKHRRGSEPSGCDCSDSIREIKDVTLATVSTPPTPTSLPSPIGRKTYNNEAYLLNGCSMESTNQHTSVPNTENKKIPSVPTPDWTTYNNEMDTDKEPTTRNNDDCNMQYNTEDISSINRVSVISSVSNQVDNTNREKNQTPTHSRTTGSTTTPAMLTSQSYIAGDVVLTPTHSNFTPQAINPHSAMTAITPMVSGTDQAKNSIKVQNCVSTIHLGCELKLLDIYCRTRFSEYNPARFHGVVMKIIDPRATALVFRSGKVLCTGLRNEHDSYIAARKFARIIQKLGYPAKFLDFKIQNFIATADLRFPIRLESLQQAHGQFASYEPELFPGLVYRMVRPRVVLLIFVNGKIVFTGGKTRGEINEALDIIYPILRSYRIS